MNHIQPNPRLSLIRLLLTACFIAGITTAAPTETEIENVSEVQPAATEAVKKEEEAILSAETKLVDEDLKDDLRALTSPFAFSEKSKASSSSEGAKLYMGAFQAMGLPMPNINDVAGIFGNLANFGNFPTLPGLTNIPGLGGAS